jgi:hypothetical protein
MWSGGMGRGARVVVRGKESAGVDIISGVVFILI